MMLQTTFTEEQNSGGEFVRQEDAFRDWVSGDGSTPWPAVPGAIICMSRWPVRGPAAR